ncbi:Protein of unknown function [Streptoalloteichus hindustanus]|uniref:LppM domain-containing protein n=1 Tax=Streptoalloteichus hindustanus TaxID=2017 RepID=A0A1M5BC64_STRHI|nr:Protein of unknown function [Streptoalloteichus hindustanus]
MLPVLVLVLAVLLGGCVRVKAAMAVNEEDRVSGELVVAALPTREGDSGPQLQVPDTLRSRVRVQSYSTDGYAGSQLFFNELGFEELRVLTSLTSATNSRYQFSLRRTGETVTLAGSVDLTQVPPDRTDVQVRISFPGQVLTTNGDEASGTVNWLPKPGQVNELAATARYVGAASGSWHGWALLVAATCVAVALFVIGLAFLAHRRHVRREAH